MSGTGLKQFPPLTTDEEAEHFVDTADLSEYDLSGFVPFNLALNQPENETYVLIPLDLATVLREEAGERGVEFAAVVRETLERGLSR